MRHKIINRLMCSLLICTMVFASGAFAFAENNKDLDKDMKSATLVKKVPSPTVSGCKQVEHKKLQNMTEEQRKAFFKENKKGNVMNKLVEDGILTKEQVKELRKSFKEGHKCKCKEQ